MVNAPHRQRRLDRLLCSSMSTVLCNLSVRGALLGMMGSWKGKRQPYNLQGLTENLESTPVKLSRNSENVLVRKSLTKLTYTSQ